MHRKPTLPAQVLSPEDAQQLAHAATRATTPCGDGHVVWHRWGEGAPVERYRAALADAPALAKLPCSMAAKKMYRSRSLMRRPIEDVVKRSPEAARRAVWNDTLGIDSLYDYDPVWDACRSLGFSPTFHMGARGFGMRLSPSNFVYNHIGHFAL